MVRFISAMTECNIFQLGDMNDLLAYGKNIMNNIRTKMWTNQGLKVIVIIVLVICNLTILYLGFFWSPDDKVPPPGMRTIFVVTYQ